MLGWLRSKKGSPGSRRANGNDDDLFDEEFQRRLEYLAIASRRIYTGRTRAERRSKKVGSGVEFADHRDYQAGDDFRYLDWNVYGRTGRLLLKLYEEEEDLAVYVLLDASRSMEFGNDVRKIDYAKKIAAAISYVALSHLDRVGVVTLNDHVEARMPPARGKGRIFKVFDFLRAVKPDGRTDLRDALTTFGAQHKKKGVAVLISDLYDPAGFEHGINTLRFSKFEPHVIQVFAREEIEPELGGDVKLVDCETGETRDVTLTPRILERYAQAHAKYRNAIETFCASRHVPYFAAPTDVPFEDLVLRVLRRGGLLA